VAQEFEARGGKANYALASNLRALLVNTQLAWYPGCGQLQVKGQPHTLTHELKELVLKQMAYGYRVDHTSGKHDDRCVALGMAALHAVQAKKKIGLPESLDLYF
jgi:hypothetical protein